MKKKKVAMVNLKDNTKESLDKLEHTNLLEKYAGKLLGALLQKYDELVLFSDNIKELNENPLWSICDNKIQTNNLMGFIGLKDDKNYCTVRISSRFTDDDKQDYFLHYMLQKVFLGQTITLDIGTKDEENFWEFYYYLFPYYINKALAQGLYKEYVHKKYNNMNLRGSIDIKRHIKQNIPFRGNIAYNTREHSYNNRITQLIRHTIEYISRSSFGKSILNSSMEIRENISQIEYLTPDFHHSSKQNTIQECYEKISNPYWEDYESLRVLCLKILNQDKLSFDGVDDKVHGILFDGAWLWEEYLATLLVKEGFIHPDNRSGKNCIYLAKNEKNHSKLQRFPDFYCNNKKIVLDAKYKRHPTEIDIKERRDDTHQMLTYMYRLKSEKGILVYPSSNKDIEVIIYNLLGHGEIEDKLERGEVEDNPHRRLIHRIFLIPKLAKDVKNKYDTFCQLMEDQELSFLDRVIKPIKTKEKPNE